MRPIFALALALAACRPAQVSAPPSPEVELRRKLGIPDDAERVVILSQSSHLDIDWKRTFDGYYDLQVRDIFDRALEALDGDERYAYSIAEMAFLERWLADRGSSGLAKHAASGRLHIVGGGLTSPDTLLTTEESLTRDALLGSLVSERLGASAPTAAWLPDSFGHSGTAPDVLAALGYRSVGLSRLDGLRDGYEVNVLGAEPLAMGSTAQALKEAGSADFIWRGAGGGEVLAHFMPIRNYCQGDLIDLSGNISGGDRLGQDTSDSPAFTTKKIESFIAELEGWSKTPYLFVPVGCDFQAPRPLLPEYAKRWNGARYDTSHVYAVAATFDEYIALVGAHRDSLPVVEGDLAPYWTGFYGSRPAVKIAARGAGEQLAGAEALWVAAGAAPARARLEAAWRSVALSNHHDFVTGTAVDDVVATEQRPTLEAAWDAGTQLALEAAAALAARVDTSAVGAATVVFNPGPRDRSELVELADGGLLLAAGVPAYGWKSFAAGAPPAAAASVTSDAGTIVLSTGPLTATLTLGATGWLLKSLRTDGVEALAAASLEWVRHTDSGGLYRIGSEISACSTAKFEPDLRSGLTSLEVVEPGPARVRLRGTAKLGPQQVTLELSAAAGADRLRVTATGASERGTTTTLRLVAAAPGSTVRIGAAAGAVEHPLTRLFTPTFWPAVRWASHGAAVLTLSGSTGVHAAADGALEWMVFRNANDERPCTSLGAEGTDDAESRVTFELGATAALDAVGETARSIALTRPLVVIAEPAHAGALPASGRLVQLSGASALITAVKPADRGEGFVVHLLRPEPGAPEVTLSPGVLTWSAASGPDLLERHDVVLPLTGADVTVRLDAALTAVRLVP